LSPLVVSNLSHSFGGVQALDGVSLQLQAGERRAIIGTNGAGKTTLFNVINGQIAPNSGEIWILLWRTASARDRACIGGQSQAAFA
jgi:branched-chain amino acid transport system ATP-binding protein